MSKILVNPRNPNEMVVICAMSSKDRMRVDATDAANSGEVLIEMNADTSGNERSVILEFGDFVTFARQVARMAGLTLVDDADDWNAKDENGDSNHPFYNTDIVG